MCTNLFISLYKIKNNYIFILITLYNNNNIINKLYDNFLCNYLKTSYLYFKFLGIYAK